MMPLQTLVENLLDKKSESRKDLVLRMGYRNITKGLRRLEDCLCRGRCSGDFLKNLAIALDTDPGDVHYALSETRRIIEGEQEEFRKRHFHPHIWILHSLKIPTNITVVAFIGIDCFKVIPVDRYLIEKSLWEQIEEVRDITQRHFIKKEGKCSSFGEITGYRYYYSFEEWVELDTNGMVLGYFQGNYIRPSATLQAGGRVTTKGVFPMAEPPDRSS